MLGPHSLQRAVQMSPSGPAKQEPLCTVCYQKYGKASANTCTCALDPGLGPNGEPLSDAMRMKVVFNIGEQTGYLYSYGLSSLHPSATEFILP